MKITFVISAFRKIHLIQHDTTAIERPPHAKTSEINNDREWERYKKYAPHIIEKFTPNIVGTEKKNRFEPPKLVGVIGGAVEWYEGVDVESWMKENI